jgi:hypothetical protein
LVAVYVYNHPVLVRHHDWRESFALGEGMIPIALVFALLFLFPQQGEIPPGSTDSVRQQQMEQVNAARERSRQAGIRVNALAANIHSEEDARAFVDVVAEQLGENALSWTTAAMRHRVAHAEYQSVSDQARLIPEQRIVNVWNEYVREINAPEESLVTLAEIHNLRDAMLVSDQRTWDRPQFQSIWTAPGIHAVKADGSMAEGCRAIEALKILHALFRYPEMLQGARLRVKEGVLVSDRLKQMTESKPHGTPPARSKPLLRARQDANPVLLAEMEYVRGHGDRDYERLMMRLFGEFFPIK